MGLERKMGVTSNLTEQIWKRGRRRGASGLTTISSAPGKQFSICRQGQHVRGPTGHLHHLVAQQGFYNGGLEGGRKVKGNGGIWDSPPTMVSAPSPASRKLEVANSQKVTISLTLTTHMHSMQS